MGTPIAAVVFALSLTVAAASHHAAARRLMAEAQQTTNPVRLLLLALDIRRSLEAALASSPEDVEVHLDLVRFHAVAPRIAGGDRRAARAHAARIAMRDPALGRFASGYLAYREKHYGRARIDLRAVIDRTANPTHKSLAMRWLGWLSQETRQWSTAFELFEALGDRYEIGRTSAFCRCELEKGRAALEAHLATDPNNARQARAYLARLEGR